MKWVWTWGGVSFGYIEEKCLRTHDGRHVGMIYESGDCEEIYYSNGNY